MIRRKNSGFTLIELMVVIGIIGLLASVLIPALLGVFSEANAKLDMQELTKFVVNLRRHVNGSKQVVRSLGSENGTAEALFAELYKESVLKIDDMRLLAGASGAKGDEEDYKADPIDTMENIIFTTTNMGKTLSRLLKNRADRSRIIICYNENRFAEFHDQGVVVMFGRSNEAELLSLSGIEREYKKYAKDEAKQLKFKKELSEMETDDFFDTPVCDQIVPY